MYEDDNYDYSHSFLFIIEFAMSFANMPFVEEMDEKYRKLWKFKKCVHSWTLGLSQFKNYVYLLHWELPKGPIMPLNLDKIVTLLENFIQEYILITL